VRTDIFKPGTTKNRTAIISYVGRYIEEKNLAALLFACQDLPIAINFIGYGLLEEPLKELAAKLQLKVNFWGNVPNEKIPGIIEASTAFLLVSIHEGHPKALIEAMSCGLAVIGSNVPGIRDLLQHKVTGYLCEPDVASIHAAILTVLTDEALRESMGRNARRYALEQFSLEKVFEKENRLLKKTIAENVRQHWIKRFNLELKQFLFGLMGMAIGRLYRPWANFRGFLTGLFHAPIGG
jgi:glycosyltransferase involved in cell wall biosynthesis